MFQFNFRAAIIRLAIKPILKVLLLPRSWESSHETASVKLISLQLLLCSPRSNFQVCRHPTQSDVNLPAQGCFFPPATALLLLVSCGTALGKETELQGAGLHQGVQAQPRQSIQTSPLPSHCSEVTRGTS